MIVIIRIIIPRLLPEELSSCWSNLHQPADQPLALHHGRRVRQFVLFGQTTGDACGCRAFPGRDDDAHAVVSAAPHGAAACIHHEADQEPAKRRARSEEETDVKTDEEKPYHRHT